MADLYTGKDHQKTMKNRKIRYRELLPDNESEDEQRRGTLNSIKTTIPPIILSEDDELHSTLYKSRGRIVAYSVRYLCLIDGRWNEVVRVDASRTERPHLHVFDPFRNQVSKRVISDAAGNYVKVWHDSIKMLFNKYQVYKDIYLSKYEKRHSR